MVLHTYLHGCTSLNSTSQHAAACSVVVQTGMVLPENKITHEKSHNCTSKSVCIKTKFISKQFFFVIIFFFTNLKVYIYVIFYIEHYLCNAVEDSASVPYSPANDILPVATKERELRQEDSTINNQERQNKTKKKSW